MDGSHPILSIAMCARDLPVAPRILAQLHPLLTQDNARAEDFAALITQDPGLSASIMRVASSPAFCRGSPPESFNEALIRLGLKEINRIVSYVVMRQVAVPLTAYAETIDFFWRKSVACAYAMELLAEKAGIATIDYHLVGLLHSIGEIMVDRAVPPRTRFYLEESRIIIKQEQQVLGWHQGTAAAFALRNWNLPESIVSPIEHQFVPHLAPKAHRRSAERLLTAKWLSLYSLGELAHAGALNPIQDIILKMPDSPLPALIPVLRRRLEAIDSIAQSINAA